MASARACSTAASCISHLTWCHALMGISINVPVGVERPRVEAGSGRQRSSAGSPRPGGVLGAALRRTRRVSDQYHFLAAPVPLFRVGECLRGLAECERPVDDRCHLAVLDDVLKEEQVRAAVDGGERDQPLAHEP
jgi:hypothetical protein